MLVFAVLNKDLYLGLNYLAQPIFLVWFRQTILLSFFTGQHVDFFYTDRPVCLLRIKAQLSQLC